MPASFLHGVETIEIEKGARTIKTVKTAVIGLVGTAPIHNVDEEYRTTLINFAKYKLVMFAMAKLMEMKTTEQNKVALYLFNSIS